MIIFDLMGHLVATESAEELHAFARKIGLKRSWYQEAKKGSWSKASHPDYFGHYDLTTANMRQKAFRFGATQVDPQEIVKRAWWARKGEGK
jgi:hypothetical protein